MAAGERRELCEVVQVLLYDDSSESSDSSDDEMEILLHALFPSRERLYDTRLSFEDITEYECERLFRFEKADVHRLLAALSIPEIYRCSQGTKTTGMEALLICLRRLSYPSRWYDLCPLFGRAESELSIIFNRVVDDLCERFSDRLTTLDLVWLDPAAFSNAIHSQGAALSNCWGFVDGTVRPISRPTKNQRIMFSGHKRVHCIKFQSVVTPNGLIAHLFGPIEGRRHDAFMLAESGLSSKLSQFTQSNGQPFVIYGDPAYGITQNILSPFRGAQVTPQEQAFNSSMSKVRVSVEWAFGKITQYFTYVDFKRNSKVLLQPVGKYYLVAALLTNCHTCLYGSLTSSFFKCTPPSLERYLLNI